MPRSLPLSSQTEPLSETDASPRGYSAHRQRQRSRILLAAQAHFAQAGIEAVSMLDITRVAGVQPSTLYQYFRSKEDLVWAVVGDILRDAQDRLQTRMAHASTALERITTVLEFMAEDLEQRAETVRFMAEFDVLYARSLPAQRLLLLEQQMGFHAARDLRAWTKEGIADGSLRADLHLESSMHAVLNAAVGTQRRLAALAAKIEPEYGQTATVLFRETVRILLIGLQATPVSPAAPTQRTQLKPSAERCERTQR